MNPFTIEAFVRIQNNTLWLNNTLLCRFEGSSDEFANQCYRHLSLGYPKFFKMDVMSKLGIIASQVLLQQDSHLNRDPYRKAMVFQNRSASLLTDTHFRQSMDSIASPAMFVYTLPNIVMGEIAIKHHFKGENTFFVSTEFNPNQISDYIGTLAQLNIADTILCAYLESSATTQDILMCSLGNGGNTGKVLNAENLNNCYRHEVYP